MCAANEDGGGLAAASLLVAKMLFLRPEYSMNGMMLCCGLLKCECEVSEDGETRKKVCSCLFVMLKVTSSGDLHETRPRQIANMNMNAFGSRLRC